jgi:hypothetical protein
MEREATAEMPKNDGDWTLEDMIVELAATEIRSKWTCLSLTDRRTRARISSRCHKQLGYGNVVRPGWNVNQGAADGAVS